MTASVVSVARGGDALRAHPDGRPGREPAPARSRLRPSASVRPQPRAQVQEIVLFGAHGGAGVTTLAAWLEPAWDMGAMPGAPDPRVAPIRPKGRPLVLVARNTVHAAGRATVAVNAITHPGERIACLVVVADSPLPEPPEATYRFRVLEGRVDAVVRMPFVLALRLVDNPTRVALPKRARRALAQIEAVAYAAAPRSRPTHQQ